jgi:hypothetical protein
MLFISRTLVATATIDDALPAVAEIEVLILK